MTDKGGHLTYAGQIKGHTDWVTALVCPQTTDSSTKVVSASRDKTLITWAENTDHHSTTDSDVAVPQRRLEGHSGFVQDVALTHNGEYALSSSWDRSLRLWNLRSGACYGKFVGHSKDVLTCAFSPDNRHILSGSRDGKMKIWNVKGECVYTLDRDAHTDWVSCVRFSPSTTAPPLIVSGGWDSLVKVWSLADYKCQFTLRGHKGYVSSVTVSPDCSLCASAGKDGVAKLWDLSRGEHLYELECNQPINQISFCPNRYWLCAATESSIRIWDLEAKVVIAELNPEGKDGNERDPADKKKRATPQCTSIAWSLDGSTLYSGYTDNMVRVWSVRDS